MASAKTLSPESSPYFQSSGESFAVTRQARSAHFVSALKSFTLVPLFPFLGYYLLDQTGVSLQLVNMGLIPKAILGEGFGHVGLCFSIHYIFTGARDLGKGFYSLYKQSQFKLG